MTSESRRTSAKPKPLQTGPSAQSTDVPINVLDILPMFPDSTKLTSERSFIHLFSTHIFLPNAFPYKLRHCGAPLPTQGGQSSRHRFIEVKLGPFHAPKRCIVYIAQTARSSPVLGRPDPRLVSRQTHQNSSYSLSSARSFSRGRRCGPAQRYRRRSTRSCRNARPSRSSRSRWVIMPLRLARRLIPPRAFSTRCHGTPSPRGHRFMAYPTARAPRGAPRSAAICP